MTGSLIVIPISRHVDYVERELLGSSWRAWRTLDLEEQYKDRSPNSSCLCLNP